MTLDTLIQQIDAIMLRAHTEELDQWNGIKTQMRDMNSETTARIARLREALEYYANELEWKEVEQTMNLCDDDCPRDCNEHNSKYKARVRPACHSMNIARLALKQDQEMK